MQSLIYRLTFKLFKRCTCLTISEGEQDPNLSDSDRDQLKKNHLEANNLLREINILKRDYVDINVPLYVDEQYYIKLLAKNDQYSVFYNYITHEMDEKAILEWFKDTEDNPKKHEVFNRLTTLMQNRDAAWPWCKKRDNEYEYCKIPQSHRKVDVSVHYESEISDRTNNHSFTPALFIGEIQGPKLNPYGAIFQEAAHTLVYIPKCFGMVVTRDEVEFIEFRRDPDNSSIQVYSNKFLMNGNGDEGKRVGIDVSNIATYIIRCLVYASLEDLPECVPLWKDLLEAGYTLGKKADFDAQDTCKCCWHFRDYADLKERYDQGQNWVPTPLGAAAAPVEND